MVKSVLKFLLLLVIVAAASFAVSVLISKRGGSDPASDDAPLEKFEGTTEYEAARKDKTERLTDEESTFAFSVPNSTELRYYHPISGAIKSVNLAKPGPAKIISTIKPLASFISWSPDGTQIIARHGSEYEHLNLTTGASKPIDRNISQVVFSPYSSDVAYLYFNDATSEGSISVADAQFKAFKNILKTRLKNWEIQWNNERRLSLIATTPTKLESLFVLDTKDKSLSQILDSKKNIKTRWSPDGSKLIISRETRSGDGIFLIDAATGNSAELGILGNASKCAWSSGIYIYCADSKKSKDDTFLKIDSQTLEKTEVLSPLDAGFVDARELLYVNSIPSLVFKNFKDGRLYQLRLGQ